MQGGLHQESKNQKSKSGFLESLLTELDFYKHIITQLEEGVRDIGIRQIALRFDLFAFRPLEEPRKALAIQESLDATFSFSDEWFGGELMQNIERHIISCALATSWRLMVVMVRLPLKNR